MTAPLLSAALLVAATLDERGGHSRPVFFDMKHSNNAARIRLWRALKEGMTDEIERRVVSYPDLKSPEFAALNPLKKVPAFIRADGSNVFESSVILGFLEDKYDQAKPSFTPATPEGRQLMQLFIRIHDVYIASPNCCAPGFSHCQGAMYLSYGWHGAARGTDLPTREAKIGEIWRQLNWLEAQVCGLVELILHSALPGSRWMRCGRDPLCCPCLRRSRAFTPRRADRTCSASSSR